MFARDTAAVVVAAGGTAMLLPRPLPTPVLAFAIRHLGADAGVMVTASHNPPQDNGYKVYLGDGSQIVPPADADIAAPHRPLSTRVADVAARGRRVGGAGRAGASRTTWTRPRPVVDPHGPRELAVVHTSLHGVGGAVVAAAPSRAPASPHPTVVAEQAEPDPAFPTVALPQPRGAGRDRRGAGARARRCGADLVLANDPDADRLRASADPPR